MTEYGCPIVVAVTIQEPFFTADGDRYIPGPMARRTHWGTAGLRHINADYTVTAIRLPDGEFVALAAQSHYGTAGVATGSATLFDRHGPIGTSSALALGQPAEAFRPAHT